MPAISNQQSAISNQQSAISNQQSAISNQQSAISNQQSNFNWLQILSTSKKTWFAATASLSLLTACASPKVATVVQPHDQHMTCAQLIAENLEMERLFAEADSEKGFTGGNVLRFLFFWPAIIGTHMNANEAINAARQRQVHINHLMTQRGCFNDSPNHRSAAPNMPNPNMRNPSVPNPNIQNPSMPTLAPRVPVPPQRAYNPYAY